MGHGSEPSQPEYRTEPQSSGDGDDARRRAEHQEAAAAKRKADEEQPGLRGLLARIRNNISNDKS
jgi:hypothetical protein